MFSLQNRGIKLGLDRTRALMSIADNPEENLPSIQIVGTNGKGSTAAFLDSIFRTAGLKSGLFTSPHLTKLNERIRINGKAIDDNEILNFIDKYKLDIDKISASFFEVLTALGFTHFKKNNVDIAVLETGLGGRLDSVSVCNPKLLVITSISLDHTEILGNTLEKIASEKAGAMKPGVPCISVEQATPVRETLIRRAKEVGTTISWVSSKSNNNIVLGLAGKHQKLNASLAIEAIKMLDFYQITPEHVKKGLQNVKFFGRFQEIQAKPTVIFDVGHNKQGISAFLETFCEIECSGEKHLILSLQNRKNISSIINDIENQFDRIVCTSTSHKSSMDAKMLAGKFSSKNKIRIYKNAEEALNKTMSNITEKDVLAIVGTHYFGSIISKYYKMSFDNL